MATLFALSVKYLQNAAKESPPMDRLFKSNLWTYRLLRYLLMIIGVTIVLHVIMQTANYLVYPHSPGLVELSNRFDFDDEASIPTWISQILLVFGAVLAFITARFSVGKKRLAWYWVSLIVMVASLDEVARLHELVVQSLHVMFFGAAGTTILRNAWLFVLPVVVIVGIFVLVLLAKALPKRTLKIIIIASIVFFAGAIGVEILSSGLNPNSWMYTVWVTALEEGMELVGTAIFVFAVANYMETKHHAETKQLLEVLKVNQKT